MGPTWGDSVGPSARTAVSVASPSSDTKCASVHGRLSLSVCIWYPASCYFAVMLSYQEWAHGHTNTNGTVLSAVCPACPTGHKKPHWGVLRRKEANAFQCLSAQSCFTLLRKGFWSHPPPKL